MIIKGQKKKRIIAVMLIVLILVGFSDCGNKEWFDTTWLILIKC